VSCDTGKHSRTRQCNDPAPKNGGKACVGDDKQLGNCVLQRCGLGKKTTLTFPFSVEDITSTSDRTKYFNYKSINFSKFFEFYFKCAPHLYVPASNQKLGSKGNDIQNERVPYFSGGVSSSELCIHFRRKTVSLVKYVMVEVLQNNVHVPVIGPYDCEFEAGVMCHWELCNKQSYPRWYRESQPTGSSGTGPKTDHTSGSGTQQSISVVSSVTQ